MIVTRPISTMQKTDWINYSTFLVWSGLEKGFTYEQPFSCKIGHFGHDNKHPNTQPGKPALDE